MSTPEALKTWTSFLEKTPPNTPVKIPNLATRTYSFASAPPPPLGSNVKHTERHQWNFKTSHIQLHCDRDDGLRRFNPCLSKISTADIDVTSTRTYKFITYQCRDCQTAQKTFAVVINRFNDDDVEAMKLGEFPPFSAPISSRIQQLLSESNMELYRKGVRSEAQGLGLGAATYFRRIVEGQWTLLVMEIRRAAERFGVKDLSVYDAAIKETQFSKAVKTLGDAIPEKLLISDGKNPLTLLHRPLSKQLHGLTDEACLQQAADIRIVLTALLENIADVLKDRDELTRAAERLTVEPSPTD